MFCFVCVFFFSFKLPLLIINSQVFSIIHEEKTKVITTVKKVYIIYVIPLIIIKFGELYLWTSPQIIKALRSNIKHSKECFIRCPNTSKLVENPRLLLIFSTQYFSVFGYVMKHSLILVFDILPYIKTGLSISHQFHFLDDVQDFSWEGSRLIAGCSLFLFQMDHTTVSI